MEQGSQRHLINNMKCKHLLIYWDLLYYSLNFSIVLKIFKKLWVVLVDSMRGPQSTPVKTVCLIVNRKIVTSAVIGI